MTCGLLGQEEKVFYLKQQLKLIDGQDVPPTPDDDQGVSML